MLRFLFSCGKCQRLLHRFTCPAAEQNRTVQRAFHDLRSHGTLAGAGKRSNEHHQDLRFCFRSFLLFHVLPDKIRDPVIQRRRVFLAVSAKHKADIHGACTKHCFLLFTRGLTDFPARFRPLFYIFSHSSAGRNHKCFPDLEIGEFQPQLAVP